MPELMIIEDETLHAANPGGQQRFMDDLTHRYVAFAGGWYSGKTWAGARKQAMLQVLNAFDDAGQPTYVKGLVVAQNYSLAKTQCIPELAAAFDEMGLTHRFIASHEEYCFEFPDLGTKSNPNRMLVRSAETPETITAFTVGHAWGDEAGRWRVPANDEDPRRNPFIQIDGRVRDSKARVRQINFTFTHEGDDTQVFTDFEESPLPDHVLYRSSTYENPAGIEFANKMKARLTKKLADQYVSGMAVRFNGTNMYSSYRKEQNLDDSIVLDRLLPLHLSIDFNISPGMHGVIGQYHPSLELFTARKVLHAEGMDTRRMMQELRRYVEDELGGFNFPELWLYGDASGRSRWAGTGQSCWDIVIGALRDLGWKYRMKVPASNPLVADRVAAFNCVLEDLNGRVRYKVHSDCDRLIADLRQMKWKKGEADKDDRMLSHASDAEGYRVYMIAPVHRVLRDAGAMMGMVGSV